MFLLPAAKRYRGPTWFTQNIFGGERKSGASLLINVRSKPLNVRSGRPNILHD